MWQPRLGLVGPMLAATGDRVLSQTEVLAHLFAEEGYEVRTTSAAVNPLVRLADIASTLFRWRHELDVIIAPAFSGKGFALADTVTRVGQATDTPVILCLRGGDLPRFAGEHPVWVRSVLLRASILVAPSGYLAQAFRKWAPDIRVIPNVIELARYPFRLRLDPSPRLLWMRSLDSLYNPEMALRATALLRQDYLDIRLMLAGQEGDSSAACVSLIKKLDLHEHVSMPGFLSGRNKMAQLAAHDVYLHTNRVDNMPVSMVEAAACGLLVVATRVGGVPAMVRDEESALLVDSDDHEQMAAGIARLLQDHVLAGRLSRGARAVAERSAWPDVRHLWESVFDSCGISRR